MVTKNKVTVFIAFTLFLSIIWGISCAPAKNKRGVHPGDIALPHGALLVSDNQAGVVYRIGYKTNER
jgi:hypothetical protein